MEWLEKVTGFVIAPQQPDAALSVASSTNPWDLDHYHPPLDDTFVQDDFGNEDVKSQKSGSSQRSSVWGSARQEESSAVVPYQPKNAIDKAKCPDCHLSLRRSKVRPSSDSRTNTSHTEAEMDDDEDICICTPCQLCNKNMCGILTKKIRDPRRGHELQAKIHARVGSGQSAHCVL